VCFSLSEHTTLFLLLFGTPYYFLYLCRSKPMQGLVWCYEQTYKKASGLSRFFMCIVKHFFYPELGVSGDLIR